MSSQHRHELTDEQWDRLEPLLSLHQPSTGRPAKDHRLVLSGMGRILRTGAPWRDLLARYENWVTVYSRVRRWRDAGIWDRILLALQSGARATTRSMVH